MQVGRTRRRFGRVAPAETMHLVEMFGLSVVGLEIFIRDRPRGRDAAMMLDLAEVLLPQADQRGAVELGVAADEVVCAGMKLFPVPVVPRLFDVVAVLDLDGV